MLINFNLVNSKKMQLTVLNLQEINFSKSNALSFNNNSNKYTITHFSTEENRLFNIFENNIMKLEDHNTNNEFYIKLLFNKENRTRYSNLCKSLNYINNSNIELIELFENELKVNTLHENEENLDFVLFPITGCISLKEKLNELVTNKDIIGVQKLFTSFLNFVKRYKHENLSHGNLNDENIMVAKNGEIVLNSFFSHFTENGRNLLYSFTYNNNFVHSDHEDFSNSTHVDDFTLLTIATSIYAFSIDPELFTSLHCNNMLLFSYKDFKNIEKARIYTYLNSLHNDYLNILVFRIKMSLFNKSTEIADLAILLSLNEKQIITIKESIEKDYYETAIESKDEYIGILKHNYCNQIKQNSVNFIIKENLESEKTYFQKKYMELKLNSKKSITGLAALSLLMLSFVFVTTKKNGTASMPIAYINHSLELKNNKLIVQNIPLVINVPKIVLKPNSNVTTFTRVADNRKIEKTKTIENAKTTKIENPIEKSEPTVVFKEIVFSK